MHICTLKVHRNTETRQRNVKFTRHPDSNAGYDSHVYFNAYVAASSAGNHMHHNNIRGIATTTREINK